MSKTKWMIIKHNDDVPLEVWRFIDDINVAMQFPYVADAIKKYGEENVMPIVMNDLGGYHTHKPTAPDVVAIVERATKPCISVYIQYPYNRRTFETGWISPDCNTFSCDYMGHYKLADKIASELYGCDDLCTADDFLLDRGWIKVNHKRAVFDWEKINDRQAEYLKDRGISIL